MANSSLINMILWVAASVFVGVQAGKKRKIGAAFGVLICIFTSPLIGYVFIANSPYLDENKNDKCSKSWAIFCICLGCILLIGFLFGFYNFLSNANGNITQTQVVLLYEISVLIGMSIVIVVNHYNILRRLNKNQ